MKSRYSFLWSNTQPLFTMTGNIRSFIGYPDVPFNDAKHVFQVARHNYMISYLGTDDLERNARDGEQYLDPEFSKRFIADAQARSAAHQAFYAKCRATNFAECTPTELAAWWNDIVDNFAATVAYFRGTQEEPTRALIDAIAAEAGPEELSELLISPEFDLINREASDWQQFLKSPWTRDGLFSHLMAYPWLLQNAASYEEALDELQERAKALSISDVREEKKRLAARQALLLGRHSDAVRGFVRTAQRLAVLRVELKASWSGSEFHAIPIATALARHLGERPRTILFDYHGNDVEEAVRRGKKLSTEEVEARRHCTVEVLSNGAIRNLHGEEAETLAQAEVQGKNDYSDVREILGISARPGKVVGRVHILTTGNAQVRERFRREFTGGIIVTSMTQPNVIDIVRKASAIVTDEGSMLSHAAIISREFGIPCIVHTKIATSVLKDGDLIEVDAGTGTIKLLSRPG